MGYKKTRAAARFSLGLKTRFALAAVAAITAGSAGAANEVLPPDRYVGFGGLYMLPGDREVDYGIGFDLAYGRRIAQGLWWEGNVFTTVLETGDSAAPDWYQSGLGLNLIQSFSDERSTHLYGLLGGGVAINDATPDENDGTSVYANVGFGVRGKVWQDWGVRPRADLRYVYDTFDEGVGDIVIGLALEIPPKREKIVERIVQVEKIVEVPVEVEKIVEKEVVCVVPPVEAPAAPVEPVVESDTDRDGVPDSADTCPETLAGAKVDEKGCVKEQQKISLPNIEFEPASIVLAGGGKEKLEAVVAFLQNQKGVQIDIFGHTDSQGRDAYNLKLSDGRANSVMTYLVSRGVEPSRLTAKGFGETQPIATNETVEGRALNRRVELLLRTK
ncbi:MAG TPA: OmpA family protein [Verrucomicrobiae bacterium]|nr:OmpA family protein [Verrucomicrobiae bacterium]